MAPTPVRVRTTALTATLVVSLSGITACSGGDDDSDSPRDAADALAGALADKDVGAIAFQQTSGKKAQSELETTLDGMGDATPEVSVDSVDEHGDTAKATLQVRWSLSVDDQQKVPWSYHTEATLRRDDGEWKPQWSTGLLAKGLEHGERLSLTSTQAKRGKILGAGGTTIVKQRPVVRVGIDKTQLNGANAADSARKLATMVGIDAGDYVDKVKASGPEAFVEAIVLRKSDVDDYVNAGAFGRIKGAEQYADTMPLAPSREFAEPILGTVGEATAALIKQSHGELHPGDETGLSGLQQRYDQRLRGKPGLAVEAVAKSGKQHTLFSSKPENGKPLRTTLDVHAQNVAQDAVDTVKSSPSALVAIRPSTGDIIAAASGPGSDGYSTATLGQYAPGSTFKVVSSLALLRNGLSPDDIVDCSPTITVDGKQFKNYDDYPPSALGRIPFREAIAQSCNTAVISKHEMVSQADLADAAASLGLGVDHDTGFSSYFGDVPDNASGTEHAASMIGQGQVLASPMAMALVAASVADGSAVVPTLVSSFPADKPDPDSPLTSHEAQQLRALMRGVVTEGSGSALQSIPGPPVGAKTGTAEYGDGSKTHAWMIATQGDLAVAAFVEDGESGSGTAGPLLEKFLRAYR